MSKLAADAIEICKKFDKNGDGYITKKELRNAFKKSEMSDKEIGDLLKKADENHDGKVNYEGNAVLLLSFLGKCIDYVF